MNIYHLHEIRDGKSIRRRKAYNPYIHLSDNTPMMQMLFSITRPAGVNQPTYKPPVKPKKIVKGVATLPAGSMVKYTKERRSL
jgi:hypothetical protein